MVVAGDQLRPRDSVDRGAGVCSGSPLGMPQAARSSGDARATRDLNLVVHLSSDNALAAVRALEAVGYRPQVPVGIEALADPQRRRTRIEDKGMKVFPLISDRHRDTAVDIFVTEPFPFNNEYGMAESTIPAPVSRSARSGRKRSSR